MRRHAMMILCGTLLATAPALGQTNSSPSNAPGQHSAAPPQGNQPMFQMKPGQWRSSKLIGVDVYNNNNEKIGDINELILDQQGKVEAVVVGVGGFLGMGEHDVALPFNQVKFSEQPRTNATANRTDTAPTSNRQTQTNPPASNTTGSSAGTRDGNTAGSGSAYRGYPDHAVVNMTNDQLKGMPQVRYAR